MHRTHSPIKLGVVIGSLARGGAETHLSQVLPELVARGHQVSVFVTGPLGPIAEQLQAAGVVVEPRREVRAPRGLPVWLRRAVRLARLSLQYLPFAFRHRGGVLHFFLPEAMIFGALLTAGWHRRLITSVRGTFSYRAKYPTFVTSLERWLLRRMNLVLANSLAVATQLIRDGIPSDRVRTVYSGLSQSRLNPPGANRQLLRAELGIGPDTFVIIALANLFPYKGHADLFKALGILCEGDALGRDWLLVCIGRDVGVDGYELVHTDAQGTRSRLEELALRYDFSTRVRFLGERADAPILLRIADLAVLPSHEEGFSNALLEKMAAALPIVATTVGGNAEALEDGRVGLLVPPHDPSALAAAIRRLAGSPEVRAELGRRARERAQRLYSITDCVDQYEAVYAHVTGAAPHQTAG